MISTQEWYDALRTDSIKIRILRAMLQKAKAIWREILAPDYAGDPLKAKVAMEFAGEIITGMRAVDQQPTHLQQILLGVADELESLEDDSLITKVDEAIELSIAARWFRVKP